MTFSTKSPAPKFGDGYNLRAFRGDDLMYLVDIDAKCSEQPWCYDQWVKGSDTFTGSVVTFFGTPVGFSMFKRIGEYVEIVKFAVKPQYRRQKLGDALMCGCRRFCTDMGCHTVFLVLPETMLRIPPDVHDPAVLFLTEQGFKAVNMLRDFFNSDGVSVSGVKFALKIDQPNPRRTYETNH